MGHGKSPTAQPQARGPAVRRGCDYKAIVGASICVLVMAVGVANGAQDDAAAVVKAKLAALKAAGVAVD